MQFVDFPNREAVDAMTHMRGLLDVIIPRGGAGLIQHIVTNSTVPVIETGTGVCHTFVDETADFDMAIKIAVNAKTSHPSVCNAMETLLYASFDETHILDLRHYTEKSLKDYISEYRPDIVLCIQNDTFYYTATGNSAVWED